MPEVQKRVQNSTSEDIEKILSDNIHTLDLGEISIDLQSGDIEISRIVKDGIVSSNEGKITIVLDTVLNEELISESYAREVINKVNTMRRDQGFDVTDRIIIKIDTTDPIKQCFQKYKDFISNEVLADAVDFEAIDSAAEWDLNGEHAKIILKKVS